MNGKPFRRGISQSPPSTTQRAMSVYRPSSGTAGGRIHARPISHAATISANRRGEPINVDRRSSMVVSAARGRGSLAAMKQLIVAADDFAQNAAVDDGILGLIAAGRISAASCLAASPRWPQAARRLEREVRAKADIGVHLDLTEFVRPAGGHVGLVLASYTGTLAKPRLRVLIDEQLQRFEDAVGMVPDYVDGRSEER